MNDDPPRAGVGRGADDYLSAEQAAALLGVRLETLYAYVSRGLLRSEPAGGRSRARRYHAADVERLRERRLQRGDPSVATRSALRWGLPVLESAITLIEDGRLHYRGHDAIALATSARFEAVAALLWTGDLGADALYPDAGPVDVLQPDPAAAALEPVARFQRVLPLLAAADPRAWDLRPEALPRAARRLVAAFVAVATGRRWGDGDLALALERAWAPDDPAARALLNAALVLCADHELNSSAFTVRCIASARAPLASAVLGGLAALQGTRHGAASFQVEALFREVAAAPRTSDALHQRLRRGDTIPGFGHPLYPAGDPRARLLLDLLAEAFPTRPALLEARALIAAATELVGERPNVELALVTLARCLGLPPGSALTVFALGRTAGWVAHALEEYARDQLILPRARYTGPPPAGDGAQRKWPGVADPGQEDDGVEDAM